MNIMSNITILPVKICNVFAYAYCYANQYGTDEDEQLAIEQLAKNTPLYSLPFTTIVSEHLRIHVFPTCPTKQRIT